MRSLGTGRWDALITSGEADRASPQVTIFPQKEVTKVGLTKGGCWMGGRLGRFI